jgi:UDP-N-acetylmuramate--alanine ligase
VKDAFVEFVENVPFYGAAVLCVDHPEVQTIIPRSATGASSPTASRAGRRARRQCRADSRRQPLRRVVRDRDGERRTIERHRAADARPPQCPERAGRDRRRAELGIATRCIARGFERSAASSAASPGRRVEGATIIDDYGHHPVEIRAVLSAAREGARGG